MKIKALLLISSLVASQLALANQCVDDPPVSCSSYTVVDGFTYDCGTIIGEGCCIKKIFKYICSGETLVRSRTIRTLHPGNHCEAAYDPQGNVSNLVCLTVTGGTGD